MKNNQLKQKQSEFPNRDSAVALTFEIEIKRMASEKDLEVGKVIELLADETGLSERQIYNYRSGKTDIPSMLIPVFCKQFGSNALAMAIVTECNEIDYDEMDLFDLGRFASRSVQEALRGHDDFLEAFDDGVIDGHELTTLSISSAKIVRNANRLLELAHEAYNRRMPAAA